MALDITPSYNNLKTGIQASNATVTIGGVVSDILTSVAAESTRLQVLQRLTSRLQSLDGILTTEQDDVFISEISSALGISTASVQNILTAALDSLAQNYTITRRPATAATGTVFFARATPLSGSDVTVPAGTAVTSTNGVQYVTTAAVTMSVANASAYYDSTLQLYGIEAPVEASTVGTAGNTPAGTITNETNLLTQLPLVTNKSALTNGFDIETDAELVTRIKVQLTGNNIGSADGYKKLVLQSALVSDVAVVGAGNPLMLRDRGFGGAVDIYLLETREVSAVDTVATTATPAVQCIFSQQPVSEIFTVVGTKGAVSNYVFTEGTDYIFVKDTNVLTRNSFAAQDRLVWIPGQEPDAVVGSYSVQYGTDSNIAQIQNLLTTTVNQLVGANILVRQGVKLSVDVSFTIALKAGSLLSVVQTAVSQAMQEYANNLKFGQALYQSDLIAIAETTAGVDYVVIPVNKFNLSSSTGTVDTIAAGTNQYIRLNTITLTT